VPWYADLLGREMKTSLPLGCEQSWCTSCDCVNKQVSTSLTSYSTRYHNHYYKKDGYRQRNVTNVRQFLHILASPGYAPGTIAVNVYMMGIHDSMLVKRIAAYTHISSSRLRAIARYWSEIATFSYPLAFNAPVGGVPIGIPGKRLVRRKLESWGYQAVKTVWR